MLEKSHISHISCSKERERRTKRGASVKLFCSTGHRARLFITHRTTGRTVHISIISRTSVMYVSEGNHVWHVRHRARAPSEARREREIFFSAGHRACNAKSAYRTTRTNTYSWHILLFVSDAKLCMACMCGIVRERRAKRGASAKKIFLTWSPRIQCETGISHDARI